jgi:hypothetical protein
MRNCNCCGKPMTRWHRFLIALTFPSGSHWQKPKTITASASWEDQRGRRRDVSHTVRVTHGTHILVLHTKNREEVRVKVQL